MFRPFYLIRSSKKVICLTILASNSTLLFCAGSQIRKLRQFWLNPKREHALFFSLLLEKHTLWTYAPTIKRNETKRYDEMLKIMFYHVSQTIFDIIIFCNNHFNWNVKNHIESEVQSSDIVWSPGKIKFAFHNNFHRK